MIITFVNLVSAKQVTEKSAILIRFVGGLSPKCCSCEYVNIQKHSVCKSGLQHPGDTKRMVRKLLRFTVSDQVQ